MGGIDFELWSKPQQRAIQARGSDVIVSAGAGSGKTSVLVERIVWCLLADENPVDVDELLVVTFTEAAAAEMKHRIAMRLQEVYAVASQQSDVRTLTRISRAQVGLNQAQISTLHSFCLDIVQRNFLGLNLDPAFTLMAEDEAKITRKQVFVELINEILTGEMRDTLLSTLQRLYIQDVQALFPLILRIYHFAQSQPHPELWLEQMVDAFPTSEDAPFASTPFATVIFDWLHRQLVEAFDNVGRASKMAGHYEGLSKYVEHLQSVSELLNSACHLLEVAKTSLQLDWNALTYQMSAIAALSSPRAAKGADEFGKEQVQALRKKANALIKQVTEIVARGEMAVVQDLVTLQPTILYLTHLVIQYSNRYMAKKRELARLDFADLEHLALQAIDLPETGERIRLQQQFAEIFVDEYQDTSPIQDALVAAIARYPGNVFVVGDVKQSIYRFRMAEPALFLNKYQRLSENRETREGQNGQAIDLSDNYRSRKEIVDCVNFLFHHLFNDTTVGFSYDHRAAMKAGAVYPPSETNQPRIEFHLIDRDGEELRRSFPDETEVTGDEDLVGNSETPNRTNDTPSQEELSAIEKEAWVVGKRILQMLGKIPGHQPEMVWDKRLKQERPIQYRDIVVLLRSIQGRTSVFLDVFRKLKIPGVGAANRGFFAALEIQWLQSLLRVIDNPEHIGLDVATVLRSPFFLLSDEELANIATFHHSNFYQAVRLAAKSDCVPAIRVLHRLSGWREIAKQASAEFVIRRVLTETGFLHYITGMPGGLLRKANVEAFLSRVRAFDARSSEGVYGFVRQLEEEESAEVDFGEAGTVTESEDVVRIMTIHRSKGLEFPVVFVADLGKKWSFPAGERNFGLHRTLGFGPTFCDMATHRRWKTVASLAIEEQDKAESLAEEARVLYVALTRARERLIFVASGRRLSSRVARAQYALVGLHEEARTISRSAFLSAEGMLDWLYAIMLTHQTVGHRLRDIINVEERIHIPAFCGPFPDISFTLWNHALGLTLPTAADFSYVSEAHGPVDEDLHPLKSVDASIVVETEAEVDRIKHEALRCAVSARKAGQTSEWLSHLYEASEPSQWNVQVVDEPTLEFDREILGKLSATDLRRLWVARRAPDRIRNRPRAAAERLLDSPKLPEYPSGDTNYSEGNISSAQKDAPNGREAGSAFHAVMQQIDFTTAATIDAVSKELHRLREQELVAHSMLDAVHLEHLVGWFASPIGRRVAKGLQVFREQPFFHRIDLPNSKEYVVAQGVIDCLVEEENQWLIVDYKTDEVDDAHVHELAKEYEAQVATYLAAISPLTASKPAKAFLYFVKPQVIVQVEAIPLADVFLK